MLGKILKDVMRPRDGDDRAERTAKRRVLNVGGGTKTIPIPSYFADWEHLLLDVDARGSPDIVCDARELHKLPAARFDAVYCSHNLEHYFRHDALKVLRGFLHVLKPDGFADIRVPDIQAVMNRVVEKGMDLADTLYDSPRGPITVLDVLYGFGSEIEQSGKDFYAHKTGFTPKLLHETLIATGFRTVDVYFEPTGFEIRALAYPTAPTAFHLQLPELERF